VSVSILDIDEGAAESPPLLQFLWVMLFCFDSLSCSLS
jgi:hypothetical protein